MLSYEGIAHNFRFLIVQVVKQLENTAALLDQPARRLIKAIEDSEDYVDTQKSMIENECYELLARERLDHQHQIDAVRALNTITSNLERISDFAVNIARNVQHLGDRGVLRRFDCRAYITALKSSLNLVAEALFTRNSALALRICHAESEVDQRYRADLQAILASLRATRDVDDLVTAMFILHYLERMGDALLNIGEAVIFAVLGERLKIHQYRALDEALAATPALDQPLAQVEVASIWGTRSGVRIGTLEDAEREGAQRVLFKQGNPEKLLREKDSLQRWAEVAPGLVPEVVEYNHQGTDAALLLQYLDGATFRDVLLNGEAGVLERAAARLEATLRRIWERTRLPVKVGGEYMQQLSERVDDVFRLHPALQAEGVVIAGRAVPDLAALLAGAAEIDAELKAPFSVFIHGDFNLDNLIYNARDDKLHFVDVHRSGDMDYVQDVSVFLVSHYRLPVFVPRVRDVIEGSAQRFLRFARGFAAEGGDETFEARLGLGLARSLATSARFELNTGFARDLFQRAVLLLGGLLSHRGRAWSAYRLPAGILTY